MHHVTMVVYAGTEKTLDRFIKDMDLRIVPRTGDYVKYDLHDGLAVTERVSEVVISESGEIEVACFPMIMADGSINLLEDENDLEELLEDMVQSGWDHASRRENKFWNTTALRQRRNAQQGDSKGRADARP